MNRRDAGKFAFAGAAAMAAFYGAPPPARAEAAALGPVLAVISHPVADYAAWRAVYDGAEPVRAAAGVTGAEVFLDAANPLMVVVLHRFLTIAAAQGFLNDPGLAEAMKKGGVTAPPVVTLAIAA